jgi:hypothetical protein
VGQPHEGLPHPQQQAHADVHRLAPQEVKKGH